MIALALFILFCMLSEVIIGFVGGWRVVREQPSVDSRELYARVSAQWSAQLRALRRGREIATVILVLVVLL